MINIRLVHNKDDGGIRQSERQYIPELKDSGIKVIGVVIGDDYGNYSDQKDDFAIVHDIEVVNFIGGPLTKLRQLFKSIKMAKAEASKLSKKLKVSLCESERQKIVINIRRITLLPMAYFLAFNLNAKLVYHSGSSYVGSKISIHYFFYWLIRKLPKFSMLANSRFSAKSYGLKSEFFVYPGFSPTRVNDSASESGKTMKSELGIPSANPVFLYVARLNYDKAPDILVKAFLSSNKAHENQAYLVLVGPIQNDELYSQIKQHIINSDGSSRVIITGPQTNVGDWYKMADIFVNSRRGVEPFGISIVEAMANGLPVITSAYGGPTETVSEAENGWLVRDLTIDGYRNGIELALTEKNKWPQYGRNSLSRAESFSSVNQVKRYVELVF